MIAAASLHPCLKAFISGRAWRRIVLYFHYLLFHLSRQPVQSDRYDKADDRLITRSNQIHEYLTLSKEPFQKLLYSTTGNTVGEESSLKLKKKQLLAAIVLSSVFLIVYLSVCFRAANPEAGTQNPINSATELGPLNYLDHLGSAGIDPEPYYGVKGYVTITAAPGTAESLYLRRSQNITLTILLHLVALQANFTEAHVNIDPGAKWGGSIEFGNGGTTISFNNFVSYDPSGNLTIKAGHTIPVKMTIAIPKDVPFTQQFCLGAVGIWADVPVYDNLGVIAHG